MAVEGTRLKLNPCSIETSSLPTRGLQAEQKIRAGEAGDGAEPELLLTCPTPTLRTLKNYLSFSWF